MEDRRGKVWDYASHATFHQRDLHSSSWVSPDTQGLIERQQGFSSSFSYITQQSRNSQSLTALREPPVEGFNGAVNGVIFPTEVPNKGCTATLRHPRKPRPSSEHIAVLGQNQTLIRRRPNSEGESQKKEAGCSRKAVQHQIKRVMDNLEQVLTALRDVHQEMKEVVQQIDYLTSSIVLNEEEQQQEIRGGDSARPPSDTSSSSGSSSSEVRLGSDHQRPSQSERQPGTTVSSGVLRRDQHSRSQSPPSVQLCPFSSERRRSLRFTCGVGCSPRKDGALPDNNNLPLSGPPQLQNFTTRDLTLPLQRSLPVRPPTPGLSPLTVNLHPPISPVSRPHSPGPSSSTRVSPISPPSTLSPKPHPPPVLSPSVIIETQVGSYQTSQSDHLCAGLLSTSSTQPPSASCPPTDSEMQTVSSADQERQASSAGVAHAASQVCIASAATAKAPAKGRRGRKPPPYPHHRLSEPTKKVKETRKTPPYPEKRRLLSTTV
ncbi:serine/arginine repetitive matrix protein 1 [Solea solea]|uniref:serine/arginine repetitive matrix protein 1 n=1 Tax=Solea solea TaxID=90069 RepID=UPI00272C9A32|nr:serine/arginine repetitive matrix protein 1 [Solea solea]XP_058494769.1 serine/arginine repetitive matrix protein 1 [Solea solea]